ncbi:IS3 family transposase [Gordonia lacunae]|uniref:Integrase catalytic domain-containing protein n=1 Tax=Gordonia lacunae TaxID=417102 RepID=A0A243QC35_9ACTN|nr:hypothetical protein CA982_07615 [Gordonia lacunae]
MSRKGNCYDNAVREAFFGHLKEECFHHVTYLDTEALEAAPHDYIHWYNHNRTSERLEGLSPVQYPTQTLVASPPELPVQPPGSSPSDRVGLWKRGGFVGSDNLTPSRRHA